MPENASISSIKAQSHKIAQNSSVGQNGANKGIVARIPTAEMIELLVKCESGGNPGAIGDNGKARGVLQFHRGTLKSFAVKYGLRTELTEADYSNTSLQREVARKMIEENKNNLRHWLVCSRKQNLLTLK